LISWMPDNASNVMQR